MWFCGKLTVALVPPPDLAPTLTWTPRPWPVAVALETVNFSLQLAELAFKVIWCLTLKSAVPLSTGRPLTTWMTSTWTVTHSHSLKRLIVMRFIVQVTAAAELTHAPDRALAAPASTVGEVTVTRSS